MTWGWQRGAGQERLLDKNANKWREGAGRPAWHGDAKCICPRVRARVIDPSAQRRACTAGQPKRTLTPASRCRRAWPRRSSRWRIHPQRLCLRRNTNRPQVCAAQHRGPSQCTHATSIDARARARPPWHDGRSARDAGRRAEINGLPPSQNPNPNTQKRYSARARKVGGNEQACACGAGRQDGTLCPRVERGWGLHHHHLLIRSRWRDRACGRVCGGQCPDEQQSGGSRCGWTGPHGCASGGSGSGSRLPPMQRGWLDQLPRRVSAGSLCAGVQGGQRPALGVTNTLGQQVSSSDPGNQWCCRVLEPSRRRLRCILPFNKR